MRKALGLVFVLALAATPALAQKVTIDYAHDFDFTKIKTFQYVATEKSDVKGNDLMAQRVEEMIKQELREGGGTEVQSNPDILVTYHYTSKENTTYNTTSVATAATAATTAAGAAMGAWAAWAAPPLMRRPTPRAP